MPPARDFVSDAFAHCKFIAYHAMPLFDKAGVASDMDEGCFELRGAGEAKEFISACGRLRFWEREKTMAI